MEEIGPVDYAIIAFPGNQFRGDIVPALGDLVDAGTIRIIDATFVGKDGDGNVVAFELTELAPDVQEALDALNIEVGGLFNEDDLADAAESLEPNSSAALLVWENVWARKVAQAMRDAGGELIAFERHDVVQAAREWVLEQPRSREEARMFGRRGPGLVRAAATTAVVAGTAGAVRHRQQQNTQRRTRLRTTSRWRRSRRMWRSKHLPLPPSRTPPSSRSSRSSRTRESSRRRSSRPRKSSGSERMLGLAARRATHGGPVAGSPTARTMSAPEPEVVEEQKGSRGWRGWVARLLTVLGVLLLVVSIAANFVERQALDTNEVEETARQLIDDPEIREQVAASMTEQLFASVDVQAELEARLPRSSRRWPARSRGLRPVAERLALRILERPRFQELWVQAVGGAGADRARPRRRRALPRDRRGRGRARPAASRRAHGPAADRPEPR